MMMCSVAMKLDLISAVRVYAIMSPNHFNLIGYIDKLYNGSKINAQTSWYAMMQYAMSNHLSYKAIEDLISLMQVYRV